MGLKATDRPTGMHEARGPTLADARAGRPMPLSSLPPSRNTHTLFRTEKYAREANGTSKMAGSEFWSAFDPLEAPVSAMSKKIAPKTQNRLEALSGPLSAFTDVLFAGRFPKRLRANRYRASFQMISAKSEVGHGWHR